MIDNVIEISKDQILSEAQKMSYAGFRFITATCVDAGEDKIDLFYHFDKSLDMQHYKISVQKGEEIPSISKIYFCALLVENEIKELFGVKVTDIVVDYGGHMLLSDDDLESPMLKQQITIVQKGEE